LISRGVIFPFLLDNGEPLSIFA